MPIDEPTQTEPGHGSVSRQIRRLQRGDSQATRILWDRYYDKLSKVVRRKMNPRFRRVADEEDVAIETLDELFRDISEGKFPEIANRDQFWRLLVTFATRNVVDSVNHESRQKRGGGRVMNESAIGDSREAERGSFEHFASDEPPPEFSVAIAEECARMLAGLEDDQLQTIAVLRAAGATNEQISGDLGLGLRTVERKLSIIREKWSHHLFDTEG